MAGNANTRARGVGNPSNVSTEGVILTIPSPPADFTNPSLASLPGVGNTNSYDISGSMNYTPGTGTTAVVVRCRRNSVTGAQVGTSQTANVTAGSPLDISFEFTDPAVASANQIGSYVITVQQTGGTAAGTANEIVAKVESYQ